MQTVTLTTGKHTAKFFLIRTGEIEAAQVSTGIHIAVTHTNQVVTATDYLVYGLVRVNVLVLLVYIGHFHSLSYFKLTFIHTFQSHNQAEQRRLSGTVRTDNSHDTVRRQHEVQVVEKQFVAIRLGHMLGFDNLVSQTRTVRDKNFQLFFLLLHIFVQEFVVRIQTSLTLGLTSLRSHAHPFQLAFQRLTTFAGRLLFHFHTLGLLLQPT